MDKRLLERFPTSVAYSDTEVSLREKNIFPHIPMLEHQAEIFIHNISA